MAEANLLLIERLGKVALLRLNRPEAMNALSMPLREALRQALIALDEDDSIGAIVITGNDKVFAAGADVRALQDWTSDTARTNTELRGAWNQIGAMHKPVIAAVAGMAFGAGMGESLFGSRAGSSMEDMPPLGKYSEQDKEDFIFNP